jgi:hypothetical protein
MVSPFLNNQKVLLIMVGTEVINKGKRYFVEDFELLYTILVNFCYFLFPRRCYGNRPL